MQVANYSSFGKTGFPIDLQAVDHSRESEMDFPEIAFDPENSARPLRCSEIRTRYRFSNTLYICTSRAPFYMHARALSHTSASAFRWVDARCCSAAY